MCPKAIAITMTVQYSQCIREGYVPQTVTVIVVVIVSDRRVLVLAPRDKSVECHLPQERSMKRMVRKRFF